MPDGPTLDQRFIGEATVREPDWRERNPPYRQRARRAKLRAAAPKIALVVAVCAGLVFLVMRARAAWDQGAPAAQRRLRDDRLSRAGAV